MKRQTLLAVIALTVVLQACQSSFSVDHIRDFNAKVLTLDPVYETEWQGSIGFELKQTDALFGPSTKFIKLWIINLDTIHRHGRVQWIPSVITVSGFNSRHYTCVSHPAELVLFEKSGSVTSRLKLAIEMADDSAHVVTRKEEQLVFADNEFQRWAGSEERSDSLILLSGGANLFFANTVTLPLIYRFENQADGSLQIIRESSYRKDDLARLEEIYGSHAFELIEKNELPSVILRQ